MFRSVLQVFKMFVGCGEGGQGKWGGEADGEKAKQ